MTNSVRSRVILKASRGTGSRKRYENIQLKIPDRVQGSSDRAVQAGGNVLPARDRKGAGTGSDICRRAPGSRAWQGAVAGAGPQDDQARCGDRARPFRLDRAETRLSRSQGAPQADAR